MRRKATHSAAAACRTRSSAGLNFIWNAETQQAGLTLRLARYRPLREALAGPRREDGLEAFALQALAQQLAVAAHGFGALTLLAGRGLLEVAAQLHLPEQIGRAHV